MVCWLIVVRRFQFSFKAVVGMLDILLTVQLVLVSVMVWRCRVLSRPLEPASQSLSDDLPSRSMLVAAAAKQSHQQQRTTQPPVSVFPVPCSGALLPPQTPTEPYTQPRHPHQLQVRASWPVNPSPRGPQPPLSGAGDVENSDAVRVKRAHILFLSINKQFLMTTKTRKLKWTQAVLAHVIFPLPQKYPFPSNGQSAPVRHFKCHLGTWRRVFILRFELYQSRWWQSQWLWRWWRWWCVWQMCQIWFGLSSTSQLPACAPTPPPTTTHTHLTPLSPHFADNQWESENLHCFNIFKCSHCSSLFWSQSQKRNDNHLLGRARRQQQTNTHTCRADHQCQWIFELE